MRSRNSFWHGNRRHWNRRHRHGWCARSRCNRPLRYGLRPWRRCHRRNSGGSLRRRSGFRPLLVWHVALNRPLCGRSRQTRRYHAGRWFRCRRCKVWRTRRGNRGHARRIGLSTNGRLGRWRTLRHSRGSRWPGPLRLLAGRRRRLRQGYRHTKGSRGASLGRKKTGENCADQQPVLYLHHQGPSVELRLRALCIPELKSCYGHQRSIGTKVPRPLIQRRLCTLTRVNCATPAARLSPSWP